MKWIKKYESTIAERVNKLNDIIYNIKCLLMDLSDSGISVEVYTAFNTLRVKIDTRGSKKRFTNIVDYLLSLEDYMKTENCKYNELKVTLGVGYSEIKCKIVDDKIKKYPLKEDRFIADYLIGSVQIEFTKPNIKRF